MVQLEPFLFEITITNKLEVMEKLVGKWFGWAADLAIPDDKLTEKIEVKLCEVLPPTMGEMGLTVTLEPQSREGLTTQLRMEIKDYDKKALLSRAKGVSFYEGFMMLFDSLEKLGLKEKIEDLDAKIGGNLRRTLMTKIPVLLVEKVAQQGMKVTCKSIPEPPAQDPPPESFPPPHMKILLNIALTSNIKSRVMRRLLPPKIEEHLKKEFDGALVLKCSSTKDGPKSFFLLVDVTEFHLLQLLRRAKGEDFASAFENIMEALKKMGMESMLESVQNKVTGAVIEKLGPKLAEQLSTKLKATVTPITSEDDLPGDHEFQEETEHTHAACQCCVTM